MNEKIKISRLSVFIYGSLTYIFGAYHQFERNLFWMTFVFSISLSFLSGILLRKNSTPFKTKLLIFMSSSLVMFPVFNYYVRNYSFSFCFIFPIIIFLMFIAGHSIRFKRNILKSSLILFFSVIFIAGSYFYFPIFMFHINKIQIEKQLTDFELTELNGEKLKENDFREKVILFFFKGENSKIHEISKHFLKNNDVYVAKIIEESVYVHNHKDIKGGITSGYNVLFDGNNNFFEESGLERKPGALLIDKNMNIRYIHYLNYFHESDYFYKSLTNEIVFLLSE